MTRFEALMAAIDAAGSQANLARICDISHTAVWKWVQSSKQVPAEYVLAVSKATSVSAHALRPDIYPANVLILSPGQEPDAFDNVCVHAVTLPYVPPTYVGIDANDVPVIDLGDYGNPGSVFPLHTAQAI